MSPASRKLLTAFLLAIASSMTLTFGICEAVNAYQIARATECCSAEIVVHAIISAITVSIGAILARAAYDGAREAHPDTTETLNDTDLD